VLRIVFDQDSVDTPDTLTGSIVVADRDGIDSVWLTVDTAQRVADGFFETSYSSPFAIGIRGGFAKFERVPVVLKARDVVGFTGVLDTVIVVK